MTALQTEMQRATAVQRLAGSVYTTLTRAKFILVALCRLVWPNPGHYGVHLAVSRQLLHGNGCRDVTFLRACLADRCSHPACCHEVSCRRGIARWHVVATKTHFLSAPVRSFITHAPRVQSEFRQCTRQGWAALLCTCAFATVTQARSYLAACS
jgi:hypothetical protein